MPAYYQQTGANPFHEWNPRSFSVNADMAAFTSSIISPGIIAFGIGSEFHLFTLWGGITTVGGYGLSIASTVNTFQNRGTFKQGYKPITNYDAGISLGLNIMSVIMYPSPWPSGINLIYDYYRAQPIPVK